MYYQELYARYVEESLRLNTSYEDVRRYYEMSHPEMKKYYEKMYNFDVFEGV